MLPCLSRGDCGSGAAPAPLHHSRLHRLFDAFGREKATAPPRSTAATITSPGFFDLIGSARATIGRFDGASGGEPC
jgi:hypothetical protein